MWPLCQHCPNNGGFLFSFTYSAKLCHFSKISKVFVNFWGFNLAKFWTLFTKLLMLQGKLSFLQMVDECLTLPPHILSTLPLSLPPLAFAPVCCFLISPIWIESSRRANNWLIGRTRHQCDQMGPFLEFLGNQFYFKSSPNVWWIFGQLWNHRFLKSNLVRLLLETTFKKLGLLFIPTSGHAARRLLKKFVQFLRSISLLNNLK